MSLSDCRRFWLIAPTVAAGVVLLAVSLWAQARGGTPQTDKVQPVNGGANPYRYRVRPPSFINLTVLEDLCLGHTVADVMVILGSVDIVMGEVDR